MTRAKIYMPIGHFQYLVDQAKDLGAELISVFGYGEPLLDKYIIKRIQYCTDKGLDTFITSNGSLLKLDLSKALLDAGLKHIRFSVHGFYENYEAVHRGLKYEVVLRNIQNFKAMSKNYDCRVSITVIPMANEDLEHIKDFWKGYELEIWKPHGWAGGRDYRTLARKKRTCGRPENGPVQIQADGKVIPCCFLTNAEIILGDTYKDTIEDILKGVSYEALRDCHRKGFLKGLVCEKCDQLNEDQPLLYSTIDPECKPGKTSSAKFELEAA
jgi:MoaA/NifB/PqqE/SkfB family radical SAM enzyme